MAEQVWVHVCGRCVLLCVGLWVLVYVWPVCGAVCVAMDVRRVCVSVKGCVWGVFGAVCEDAFDACLGLCGACIWGVCVRRMWDCVRCVCGAV